MATEPNNQELPSEQDLFVIGAQLETRRRGVDNPPEVLLILDVVHEETTLEWRTAIRFTKEKFIETMRLMEYLAKQEKL